MKDPGTSVKAYDEMRSASPRLAVGSLPQQRVILCHLTALDLRCLAGIFCCLLTKVQREIHKVRQDGGPVVRFVASSDHENLCKLPTLVLN